MSDTTMRIWHLAICEQCEMVMPFLDQRERAHWVVAHREANPTHVVRIGSKRSDG